MSQHLITRSNKGGPLSAGDHDSNLRRLGGFASPADLIANGGSSAIWNEGEVIATDDGHRYQVLGQDDDDYHIVTNGGLRLALLPTTDGYYNFVGFGAVGDDSTDNFDALIRAIYKTDDPIIYFPSGTFRISDTVHIKRKVKFKGDKTGILKWPSGVRGLWFEPGEAYNARPLYFISTTTAFESANYAYPPASSPLTPIPIGARIHITGNNTAYEVVPDDAVEYDLEGINGVRAAEIDVALLGPLPSGSSDFSVLDGLTLDGTWPIHENKHAHGIHSQVTLHIFNCSVHDFSGDGVHIFGAGDRKVNGPWETFGNSNYCQVAYLTASSNGGAGFFIQGYDANAGTFIHINAVANGRWGVRDHSFLGNLHIGHHIAFCGVGRARANQTGVQSSLVSYAGKRYVAHVEASEAALVSTEPGTDTNVWVPRGSGGAHSTDVPIWAPDQPEGTFFPGGAMWFSGNSSRTSSIFCYTEGGQGPVWNTCGYTWALGGHNGAGDAGHPEYWGRYGGLRGRSFTATADVEILESEEIVSGNVSMTMGGNDANGDFMLWGGTHGGRATGTHRMKARDGDTVFGHSNSTADEFARITGAETAWEFGTGAPLPKVWAFRTLGLGWGSSARRQTNGTDAPSTGTWARGDIVWNRDPSAGGNAGWICVDAGEPGTWRTFGAISET